MKNVLHSIHQSFIKLLNMMETVLHRKAEHELFSQPEVQRYCELHNLTLLSLKHDENWREAVHHVSSGQTYSNLLRTSIRNNNIFQFLLVHDRIDFNKKTNSFEQTQITVPNYEKRLFNSTTLTHLDFYLSCLAAKIKDVEPKNFDSWLMMFNTIVSKTHDVDEQITYRTKENSAFSLLMFELDHVNENTHKFIKENIVFRLVDLGVNPRLHNPLKIKKFPEEVTTRTEVKNYYDTIQTKRMLEQCINEAVTPRKKRKI